MNYIFSYWKTLKNPSSLTELVQGEEDYPLKGYKKAVWIVFILTILLYVIRDVWGIYTFQLTEILVSGQMDRYVLARLLSIVGAAIVGACYFLFQYYFVSYVLSLFTDIPFRWIQKVQLYVISIIITFKCLEFIIFIIVKYTTLFSPFSAAAIFAQFTTFSWTLFFINQLNIATFLTIVIQYLFLEHWDENRKSLLFKLIIVQLLLAMAVATISITPFYEWIGRGGM